MPWDFEDSNTPAPLGYLGEEITGPIPRFHRHVTPAVKELEERYLQRFDLFQCRDALVFLIKLAMRDIDSKVEEENIRAGAALFEGILISYCRCFDAARLHHLVPSKVFTRRPEGAEIHETMWTLRSKHFAHDVNDFRDCRVGVVVKDDGTAELHHYLFHNNPNQSVISNMGRLTADALAFVEASIHALQKQVVDELSRMSNEELLGLPLDDGRLPGDMPIKASRRSPTR